MKSEPTVDTSLYSRQIGVYGMEAMGKLIKMKILILGLRGLGVEIAKDIILAGPNHVSLYDPIITTINDLGSNFYLTPEHVGKTRRDEASWKKLSEWNPYVTCNVMPGSDVVSQIKNYNCVVITEVMNKETVVELDQICRDNKIAFIYTATLGISGFVFVDFGKEHVIRDGNGEECKTYLARIISNDTVGAVTIDDTIGGGKVDWADGDYVTFKEVKGMTELNDGEPRQIKYISPISFGIGDTSKYSEYISGGIIEQVKVPKVVSYSPLSERFDIPYVNNVPDSMDFSKIGRNELLHCAFLAVHEYYGAHNNQLPEWNNEAQCKEIIAKAKEIYDNGKKIEGNWLNNAQDFEAAIVGNVARWARAEISPVCAFLGGVVAQEIVKWTGKYTPINQWLWFDFFETVANLHPETTDRKVRGSRYDDQIAIYGNEIQNKLQDANAFMIGAGALGCEFLKNFALMGMSTGKASKVVVTDNDNIETSNWNRQFLFRKDNVGQSKSKCACEVIRKMNNDFNCADIQSRVGPENEHIFDDTFWNNQTFVIGAVDNIIARKYVDQQCTTFNRPLIDSGTLGTKAHVQMIVPHVTSCYNDSQDPQEESIPMCTMHNFPSMIEHCIEWGRDHFNEYFTDIITESKKFLENSDQFYKDLKKEGNTTVQLWKLKLIKEHIDLSKVNSFDKIIEFAVKQFTENYYYKIHQLLHNFPEDYKNNDGSMFWSGSKRVPHPIRYDATDELSWEFVKNYAIILARALSIQGNTDTKYIAEVSSKVAIPEFVPQNVKIKVNDTDADDNSLKTEDEAQLAAWIKELSWYDTQTSPQATKFVAEEFEKDDDMNGHIAFIHACSNWRARNYKIKESDINKTKLIAGKIIPAIATTTAAITGIVSMQWYTWLQTKDIQFMRNCFMNLAICLFVMTEPEAKIEMKDKEYDEWLWGPVKAIPPKWTVWDHIDINGSKTVKEFIDFIKEKYDVDISVITCSNTTIVQTFMPSNKDRYAQKIEDLYRKNSKTGLDEKKKYLFLEISGDQGDASALMPLIKYTFKQ